MNSQPGRSFQLSDTERLERFQSLREATARREPAVITEAGLRLIREQALSPGCPEWVDEGVRPELERLARAGIADADGSLRAAGKLFLDMMRWSNVQVQIEVGAGQSVRAWKSWLADERAIVLAQSSPAITAEDTAHGIAGRQPLTLSEYTLQVVTPGWVPVDALHWLGFGPQTHSRSPCQLPLSALLRRVTDPRTPPPRDDPDIARLWDQPMQMCAVTAEPAGGRVLLLDSARTGVWMLATEGEDAGGASSAQDAGTVTLTPLSPRSIWQLLLTRTVNAAGSHSACAPGTSSATSSVTGGSRSL